MKYSKIILDPKFKYPIITEDIESASDKHPLYIIADKYRVFRLRIIESDFYNEKLIGFIIFGDKSLSEKIIVFLTLSAKDNLIIRARMQKRVSMEDREKAVLLLMALLVKLRDNGGYRFTSNILPSRSKTNL